MPRACGTRASSRHLGPRAIALGGGPVPAGLLDWAAGQGIPVTPVYGMTETCSLQVVAAGILAGCCAAPSLQISERGEILIRGDMVASATRRADGWLHTGDRGRLDADGLLHVEGRIKELIVTGGENVVPLEVEQALLTHLAVADAGVAGLPDPLWGEAITAYVVLSQPVEDGEPRGLGPRAPRALQGAQVDSSPQSAPRSAAGKLLRDRLGGGPH